MAKKTSSKLSGVTKTTDNFRSMMQGVEALTQTTVLVGVPDDRQGRKENGPINNAALAYIHDKGSAAANIPKREFMEPGMRAVQDQVIALMEQAGKAVFRGGAKSVVGFYTKIGLIVTRSIKSKISEGIAPPLAESTIKGRILRVKSKKRRQALRDELANGANPSRVGGGEGLFTPLVVTGQLRNAITYVLRKIKGKGYK